MTTGKTAKWEYLPKQYKLDGADLGWRMEATRGSTLVALCRHMHPTPDEANECPDALAMAAQL